MNRERAETYLRLLAEAELRDPAPRPAPRSADAPFITAPIALTRAAWALTAVGAIDLETAEGILADAELALAARDRPEPSGAGVLSSAGLAWPAGLTGPRLGPRRFAGGRPLARMSKLMPGVPAPAAAPAGAPPNGPDRYVPVGLMILFHDELISGELDLMSYAHTAGGARFTATWRTRDLLGSRHYGVPPVEAFTLTDDRGHRYDLVFDTKGRPESTCDLTLRPDPPSDIGWLEITAPGEQAVRVDLSRRAERPEPRISAIGLSVGEHLLNRIAERLLTLAPEYRPDLRHQLAARPPAALGPSQQRRSPTWPRAWAPRSPRSRRPRSCPRAARCRPGWPRCARACASAGTGSPRHPRRTCPNPGSACSRTTIAGNPTRRRPGTASPPWPPPCPSWRGSGWSCSACTTTTGAPG